MGQQLFIEKPPKITRTFSKAYDTSYCKIQGKNRTKSFLSPWITMGIQKSQKN